MVDRWVQSKLKRSSPAVLRTGSCFSEKLELFVNPEGHWLCAITLVPVTAASGVLSEWTWVSASTINKCFFLSVLLQEYWPLFLHRSSNLQVMFEARSFSSLSLFRANNSRCAVWYTSASHDQEKAEKPRGGTKSAVKTKTQISFVLCCFFRLFEI